MVASTNTYKLSSPNISTSFICEEEIPSTFILKADCSPLRSLMLLINKLPLWGLYILKFLVVVPTVVKTVSKAIESVEKSNLAELLFKYSSSLRQEVTKRKMQSVINKLVFMCGQI